MSNSKSHRLQLRCKMHTWLKKNLCPLMTGKNILCVPAPESFFERYPGQLLSIISGSFKSRPSCKYHQQVIFGIGFG